MFCFCLIQCAFHKYQGNKFVMTAELVLSIIIKFLLWFQFFPGAFDFTFFYFFIFLLLFMFGFEYLKLLTNHRKLSSRILSITLIIFLIYGFYIVSVRNLYNSTYHTSCIYTEEEALKYVMWLILYNGCRLLILLIWYMAEYLLVWCKRVMATSLLRSSMMATATFFPLPGIKKTTAWLINWATVT